jgi:glycine/D-amino acid oxidase-like deaminating enzyme
MSVSHWRRQASEHGLVPSRGGALPKGVDLVVVGGGVAGVSAALEAERQGMRALVVERSHVASGASGRNAGFLMRGMAENYAVAIEQYGRDRARAAWRLSEDNLNDLVTLGAGELRSFQKIPSVLLALDEREEAQLRESLALLREDGFDALWVNDGADAAWTSGIARGGLVNPHDGAVNPIELLHWLSGKLREPVREGVEVASVEPKEKSVRVRTSAGDVEAERVLFCTNAYVGEMLPSLREVVRPRRGQMLSIRLKQNDESAWKRLDASYYLNFGHEYVRQTFDGTVVLGGFRWKQAERETGYEDYPPPDLQRELESLAQTMFSDEGESAHDSFEVLARWSGVMGFSPDGMPLVGPVREPWNDAQRVWFCGGFTGHGMSLGHRTATLAVRAMIDPRGADNPFPMSRLG